MVPDKTLNSLRKELIHRGIVLTALLLLHFLLLYIVQPSVHSNLDSFASPMLLKVMSITSIALLILILLVSGAIIFTMKKILDFRTKLDFELNLQKDSQIQEREERFDRSEAEKIKNERLYTMGSLAAGIIHDFKNPISNISLCIQAISHGYAEGDKKDFYLKKIEDQIDRMLNMTQDFLDYAQGQRSLKIQEVEFTETIKNQIEFHREKAKKKNVALRYSLPDPFYIKIDSHKFRRVLDNIVTNAFEVLRSGQAIQIHISTHDTGMKMEISDNGPGIPPDVLPKIFEPFFSHGKSKGSGLGLSISRKIVEDHGGSLTVTSEPGKGACFTITLPPHLICKGKPAPVSQEDDATSS